MEPDTQACANLWVAVIEDACKWAMHPEFPKPETKSRDRLNWWWECVQARKYAIEWIFRGEEFPKVCGMLSINHANIRRYVSIGMGQSA